MRTEATKFNTADHILNRRLPSILDKDDPRGDLTVCCPKLINGKVWVPLSGGYCQLPLDDPKYDEIFLWIDSQRFVELLDWIYKRRK